MAKSKLEKYTTPAGIAVYPWLTRPDTQFNPDGEYKTKLRLMGEDAEKLKDLIDAAMEESVAAAKKANKGKKIKIADAPYSEVVDDAGDPTDELEFSFKQKSIVRPKDGEPFDVKIYLFDAKGQRIQLKGYVGGGSTIKVAFNIIPFYTKLIGAGVSLRLRAVQILDLVTGDVNGEAFGFDEEEGFEGAPIEEVGDGAGAKDPEDADF